jgi:hypothetical protein
MTWTTEDRRQGHALPVEHAASPAGRAGPMEETSLLPGADPAKGSGGAGLHRGQARWASLPGRGSGGIAGHRDLVRVRTNDAIRRALEDAGIEFLDEDGVRLRGKRDTQ